MTLQEIVYLQNARNQAYRADINHIARYGDGSLPADTRVVILHQKFAGGKWLHTQLELPLAITIGELLQLPADLQPDHCSDENIPKKPEPCFTAQSTDARSRDTQLLKSLTSDQGSEIVFYPGDTPTGENGLPALPGGCTDFISLPVLYPSSGGNHYAGYSGLKRFWKTPLPLFPLRASPSTLLFRRISRLSAKPGRTTQSLLFQGTVSARQCLFCLCAQKNATCYAA